MGWIVTPSGQVCHVDRKPAPAGYFVDDVTQGPPDIWRLGRPRVLGDPVFHVATTAVEHIHGLARAGTLVADSGSPLAHLSVEAVARGLAVEVSGAEQ